jgi:hypothetical protein
MVLTLLQIVGVVAIAVVTALYGPDAFRCDNGIGPPSIHYMECPSWDNHDSNLPQKQDTSDEKDKAQTVKDIQDAL